jgi:hypothetical protein
MFSGRAAQDAAGGVRVVDVVPPAGREEGMWVVLTAGFVVLVVIYVIAFEREASRATRETRGPETLPYQVLFRDLPGPEQRVFRAMQEGAVEILALGAARGRWPAVAELAADGVPPFAPDPLDRARLGWQLRESGLVHQYVGVPAERGRSPSFMIAVVEPDPQTGERPAPGVVDEEHQLAADGRLLHVTYWKRMTDEMPAGTVLDPALAGWMQIRVRSLFEELKPS